MFSFLRRLHTCFHSLIIYLRACLCPLFIHLHARFYSLVADLRSRFHVLVARLHSRFHTFRLHMHHRIGASLAQRPREQSVAGFEEIAPPLQRLLHPAIKMLSPAYGFQNLLKEGHRHYAGAEEALLRNVEACRELSALTRSSFGPLGMRKLIVNHIDKLTATADTAAMLREVEVQHPAARLLVLAAQAQQEQSGDGVNYVLTLAGEVLSEADRLVRAGLHPAAVLAGLDAGLVELFRLAEALPVQHLDATAPQALLAAIAPKLGSDAPAFAELVGRGCAAALRPSAPRFDPEHFRTLKVLGGGAADSCLLRGFAVARAPESTVTRVERPVIAVFACAFDPQRGETKGTALLSGAADLLALGRGEEQLAERLADELVAAGATAVVIGGSLSELCLHFLQRRGLFVLRLISKHELVRLARCVGATPLARLGAPRADELGHADLIELREVGSTRVTVVERAAAPLATLVLRGASPAALDELERAARKGAAAFRAALADDRFVPGAGATEAFLAARLQRHATGLPGLQQYGCAALGCALEAFPCALLLNAGLAAPEHLEALLAANADAPLRAVDVLGGRVADAAALGVADHLATKLGAARLALHAAATVLRVDQIVMAKPAGGPRAAPQRDWDADA